VHTRDAGDNGSNLSVLKWWAATHPVPAKQELHDNSVINAAPEQVSG
jgi:hypothetical protein